MANSNSDNIFQSPLSSPSADQIYQGKREQSRLGVDAPVGVRFVVAGATCSCSSGTQPAHLRAPSPCLAGIGGRPSNATTIESIHFYSPFGWCNKKNPDNTVQCKPSIVGTWLPGAAVAKISGVRALVETDVLYCSKGGIISVTNPGQSNARYGYEVTAAFDGADEKTIVFSGSYDEIQKREDAEAWKKFDERAENILDNNYLEALGELAETKTKERESAGGDAFEPLYPAGDAVEE